MGKLNVAEARVLEISLRCGNLNARGTVGALERERERDDCPVKAEQWNRCGERKEERERINEEMLLLCC